MIAVCRRWGALLAFVLAPCGLHAQSLHGRVVDPQQRPLAGALVELRDVEGRSLKIALTAPSGAFILDAPAAGHYLYRVAAIGFQPKRPSPIDIPVDGVRLPDLILQPMTMRLPDLVALGRGRFCGKSGLADETFDRVMESANNALQIMEATVNAGTTGFEVGVIHTRTVYGAYANFAVADTLLQPLARWPVQSIEPDTLRTYGFSRQRTAGDEGTREYYGPDARILFADWFLAGHCFTVDKPKKNQSPDSLHLRFAPARKGKQVDVGGELVLDAHNLALLQFSFTLRNLPNWMPDESAGGEMEFSPLQSGLWMTRSWAIWAPIAGVGGGRRISVAGQIETYGFVTRMFSGRDTVVVTRP